MLKLDCVKFPYEVGSIRKRDGINQGFVVNEKFSSFLWSVECLKIIYGLVSVIEFIMIVEEHLSQSKSMKQSDFSILLGDLKRE